MTKETGADAPAARRPHWSFAALVVASLVAVETLGGLEASIRSAPHWAKVAIALGVMALVTSACLAAAAEIASRTLDWTRREIERVSAERR